MMMMMMEAQISIGYSPGVDTNINVIHQVEALNYL